MTRLEREMDQVDRPLAALAAAFGGLGVLLGASFTPELVQRLGQWGISLCVLTVMTFAGAAEELAKATRRKRGFFSR